MNIFNGKQKPVWMDGIVPTEEQIPGTSELAAAARFSGSRRVDSVVGKSIRVKNMAIKQKRKKMEREGAHASEISKEKDEVLPEETGSPAEYDDIETVSGDEEARLESVMIPLDPKAADREKFSLRDDSLRLWLVADLEGSLMNLKESLLINARQRKEVEALQEKVSSKAVLDDADWKSLLLIAKDIERERDKAAKILNTAEIAVHGQAYRNFETLHPALESRGDLDVKVSLWLLKKYARNENAKSPSYVNPGEAKRGALNIDTSNNNGYVVIDNDTQAIDHHPEEASDFGSAGEAVGRLIDETSSLEGFRISEGDKESVKLMLDFLELVDNASFETDKDYFKSSSKNLIGLARFVEKPESLFYYFYNNKGKNFHDLVYKPLDAKSLKSLGLTDHVKTREDELKRNKNEFKRMEEVGMIVEDSTGTRISIDIDKKASDGFNAARAVGCKTHIVWAPEKRHFFISSADDLPELELGENWKRIRGKMYIYDIKSLDDPEIRLAEVLESLSVDVDTLKKADNELGYYLQQEGVGNKADNAYFDNKYKFIKSKYGKLELEYRRELETLLHESRIAKKAIERRESEFAEDISGKKIKVDAKIAKLFGRVDKTKSMDKVREQVLKIWSKKDEYLMPEDVVAFLDEIEMEKNGGAKKVDPDIVIENADFAHDSSLEKADNVIKGAIVTLRKINLGTRLFADKGKRSKREAGLQEELNNIMKKVENGERLIKLAEVKDDEKDQIIKTLQAENAKLTTENEKKTQLVLEKSQEVKRLNGIFDKLSDDGVASAHQGEELENLQQVLLEIETENERVIAIKDRVIAGYEKEVAELKDDKNSLMEKNDILRREGIEKSDVINDLTEKNIILQSDIDGLVFKNKLVEERLSEANKKNDLLGEENKKLQEQVIKLENDNKGLKIDNVRKDEELQKIKEQMRGINRDKKKRAKRESNRKKDDDLFDIDDEIASFAAEEHRKRMRELFESKVEEVKTLGYKRLSDNELKKMAMDLLEDAYEKAKRIKMNQVL